jgi:hypothetical protein
MDELTSLPYDNTEPVSDESEYIMNEYFDPVGSSSICTSSWIIILVVVAAISLAVNSSYVHKLIIFMQPEVTRQHMNYITTLSLITMSAMIFYILSKNEMV